MRHVGSVLRISQAILYIITLTAGIACCICMGWTTKILSNCVLYASMSATVTSNRTLTVVSANTAWGSPHVCSYCTFTAVVATIYAIIWFWFYILMSDFKGGVTKHLVTDHEEGHPPDIKLLVPSLIFNVAVFVCVCVSVGMISAGSDAWCQSIEDSLQKDCKFVGSLPWTNVKSGRKVYRFLQDAKFSGWVLLTALGAKIILISVRLSLYTAAISRQNKQAEAASLLARTSSNSVTSSEQSDHDSVDLDSRPIIT